jgi:hypothetical protein
VREGGEIIYPAIFSVFQNPETDDFSLAYTLESNSFVQIDLYDTSEVHIKNFLSVQQDPGIFYHHFSMQDLSLGTYILTYKNTSKTFLYEIVKR